MNIENGIGLTIIVLFFTFLCLYTAFRCGDDGSPEGPNPFVTSFEEWIRGVEVPQTPNSGASDFHDSGNETSDGIQRPGQQVASER